MIDILTFRSRLECGAIHVDANRDVHLAFGWTQKQARRRLLRDLDRKMWG